MHHRGFDFEIAARDEEFAHRLHDRRAGDKHAPRLGAGDQVDIALPVFLLLVGEAVEFFRQGPQRLRQQAQVGDLDRQLAGPGLEQRAARADDVAQVPVLESVVRVGAQRIGGDVELDAAAHVLQRGKARLAHHPLEQHSPRNCDGYRLLIELLVRFLVVRIMQLAGERIAVKIVRIGVAARAQRIELAAPLGDDLVLVRRRARRVALVAHLTPPASGSPR